MLSLIYLSAIVGASAALNVGWRVSTEQAVFHPVVIYSVADLPEQCHLTIEQHIGNGAFVDRFQLNANSLEFDLQTHDQKEVDLEASQSIKTGAMTVTLRNVASVKTELPLHMRYQPAFVTENAKAKDFVEYMLTKPVVIMKCAYEQSQQVDVHGVNKSSVKVPRLVINK